MTKKIYVGNLSWDTMEAKLFEYFSEFGPVVSAHVVTDKFSGRSKGFGFVEMGNDDAIRAVAGTDGKELDGRELKVNIARPKEERLVWRSREEIGTPVEFFVDAGSAPPEVVAEVLADISRIFRSVSGSGVDFRFSEAYSLDEASLYD